jgi:hypothetical protein
VRQKNDFSYAEPLLHDAIGVSLNRCYRAGLASILLLRKHARGAF